VPPMWHFSLRSRSGDVHADHSRSSQGAVAAGSAAWHPPDAAAEHRALLLGAPGRCKQPCTDRGPALGRFVHCHGCSRRHGRKASTGGINLHPRCAVVNAPQLRPCHADTSLQRVPAPQKASRQSRKELGRYDAHTLPPTLHSSNMQQCYSPGGLCHLGSCSCHHHHIRATHSIAATAAVATLWKRLLCHMCHMQPTPGALLGPGVCAAGPHLAPTHNTMPSVRWSTPTLLIPTAAQGAALHA
jgi:hypothetical protein